MCASHTFTHSKHLYIYIYNIYIIMKTQHQIRINTRPPLPIQFQILRNIAGFYLFRTAVQSHPFNSYVSSQYSYCLVTGGICFPSAISCSAQGRA